MIQELLIRGPRFLYRTWQLNGELIQYTIAGSGNNTYHRYVIEEFGGCVGLEQSLHAGGQCRPHAPNWLSGKKTLIRGYCTHVADAVPAEHCRPVRRRSLFAGFQRFVRGYQTAGVRLAGGGLPGAACRPGACQFALRQFVETTQRRA